MTRLDDTPVPDYANRLRLDGRRFIVIGAGQGIGRQASHALAANGARLVTVDVDPDLAADIAGEVGAVPWSGDATKREDVERLFADAARELGGIDGFVDIVGISRFVDLVDYTDEELELAFRHEPAPRVPRDAVRRQGDGRARRVDDLRRLGVGNDRRAAPCGVRRGEGRPHVARALGRRGARPARHPGQRGRARCGVDPRVSGYLGPEGEKRNSDNAPLGRVALPADIASALLFFASDLAGYVSGQVLAVDGGVGAKFPYRWTGCRPCTSASTSSRSARS